MVCEGAVEGMSFNISSDLDTTLCGPCQLSKHGRTPITKEPYVIHPTNRFHDLRNANIDKDSTSTSARIRFKSDPYILQRSKTSTPLFTASVEAFHMPKEPLKATVKDTPYEDYPPSEPGCRNASTKESTHTSLSQAAPSLMSSQRSTWPCKTSIFNGNSRFETNLYSCIPQAIHLHHCWIQWAISTATLPHLIRILSDCHVVVKSTFLLGELKETTFDKPPTSFNQPDIKFWWLNKLPYGLKQAKMPWR
jgi:hypothetical protein